MPHGFSGTVEGATGNTYGLEPKLRQPLNLLKMTGIKPFMIFFKFEQFL